ncbi:hypothetical protein F5Y08DRAFT_345641 [Xylaria arbuscula]|nr:hypothetical protein F5Y08DRAFT_345641 [Xylaria arbuscula]
MTNPKILVTGASGYVGGTVLAKYLSSTVPEIKNASYSVLVRKQEQADQYASQGITPYLLTGLEDRVAVQQLASQFDIVVHAADSTNATAAEALIYGLRDGAQKRAQATPPCLIHLSGVSSLGDRPVSQPSTVISHEFSDKRDDIYSYMKWRESINTYAQRKTDIAVIDAGEKAGVQTYVIKAPRIYGRGTGLFNKKSVHIPVLIGGAIAAGQPEYIAEGAGVWDDVHVLDLANFYELLLGKILKKEYIPTGIKPFFFVQSTRHSWKELAVGMAKAGIQSGALKGEETKSIGLAEATRKYGSGDTGLAEVTFASSSVTKADLAIEMGWVSQKTEEDFQQSLLDDFEAAISS